MKEDVVKKLLVDARALIADEACWTQQAMARKRMHGGSYTYYKPTNPSDPSACKWCATGAVMKVGTSGDGYGIRTALSTLDLYSNCGSIVRFNDRFEAKHQDVLAVFDRAISTGIIWE